MCACLQFMKGKHADYLSRYTDVEYFSPDICYSNNYNITKQTCKAMDKTCTYMASSFFQ